MGFDTRRPPLPAPTDTTSMDDSATEVATNLTTRTDKTSYTIPEDGSPIVLSTQKKDTRSTHGRKESQTSLLIEYFEASKTGEKTKGRPSVRVKVTPSSRKSSGSNNRANDAVRITSIGSDRRPAYSRRISLGSKNVETGAPESTELSHSSESNLSSARPPVEIEVLNPNESDLSNAHSSRGLQYVHNESNVSSMPPDSMLEGSTDRSRVGDINGEGEDTITKENYLQAPQRQRSRSTSRERLTQKVMEKLNQPPAKSRNSPRSGRERSRYEEDAVSGAESSLLSSNTQTSRVTNNPRLLEVVEQSIKRLVLPEITAIRDEQRADKKLRSRSSLDSDGRGLERRVSKSSSSPNISSRPKVVLNRDGEDPGTVLSRGDSEYKKVRKHSGEHRRRRSSTHRKTDGYDEETVETHPAKGKDYSKLAAAGVAGGVLTAAALRSHDSEHDVHERRKRRSKSRNSRSRSNSIVESTEEAYTRKEAIPPMPMASRINDSEMTRESILSAEPDVFTSPSEAHAHTHSRTPIREVSRGSLSSARSPVSPATPTRTSVSKGLGMSHTNRSIDSPTTIKSRTAALAAAGLGGAAAAKVLSNHDRHVDADGYGTLTPQRSPASPAQSVSSLRKQYEDPLVPAALRPHSAASRSSAGRLRERASLNSNGSSPVTKLARSQDRSANPSFDEYVTPLQQPHSQDFPRARTETPNGEEVEAWFNHQHVQNEHYRHSLDAPTNRTSLQTNPFPEDEKRFSSFTEEGDAAAEHGVRGIGANKVEYVHTPIGVESAVASLMEPSTLSSVNPVSPMDSPVKATYSDRIAEQYRISARDDVAMYDGSTLSQRMPSNDRWAALKSRAETLSGSTSRDNVDALGSPRQSPAKSLGRDMAESPIAMGVSGIPVADDPLPEIGHYDDTKSEVSTNPSIIKGPLGGDIAGKDAWPYTPSPRLEKEPVAKGNSGVGKAALAGAVLAGGAAAMAYEHTKRQPSVEDHYEQDQELTPNMSRYRQDPIDRNMTPTMASPAAMRDEGYVTDVYAASAGARTPKADQQYSKRDIEDFNRAMDEHDEVDEHPYSQAAKHIRHASGNSHGIASPLYDSSTGKGMDHIQSKDVVALMDHLTVRDSQRNARDTEILVTLVRTGAEIRQNLEDMKRFIFEQDKLIMANVDRSTDQTVHRVLSGPRPQPPSSPRTPHRQSDEDIQAKRKGVLRRALRGLTGGKSSSDLARIEDMLMQVLDNVEQLKHQGVPPQQTTSSYANASLDSYEKLRAIPDPGYEPEGAAGTNSTPSQSGHFQGPSKGDKHVFHSGYNGRPGSETRVSTVMEGDEDEDLDYHERQVLGNQFENNERLLTPTQELRTRNGMPSNDTPPQHAATYYGRPSSNDFTPKTADRQRKHASLQANTPTAAGAPKTSRWSKTTTSSAVGDANMLESPNIARNVRPISAASRSGSDLQNFDDDRYSLQDDDRLRSTQSLAREQDKMETRSMRSQASRLTRTPSPLIPSEASYNRGAHNDHGDEEDISPVQQDDYDDQDYDFDDPKYRATRNSLNLQHPQPRQGTTNRHQNHLETKAQDYPDASATNSDLSQRSVSDFDPAMWGSAGAAALNKNRFSQAEPLSPVSMNSPYGNKAKDNSPLVPSSAPQPHVQQKLYDGYEEDEQDWEPQYSNSGFARGGRPWYSSPLGSGHLLEPIEEVRYSLETDSGRLSPEPQIASARAVDMRSTARKITGPRPMGDRSAGAAKPKEIDNSGTVRRKPVRGSKASNDTLTSSESDIF